MEAKFEMLRQLVCFLQQEFNQGVFIEGTKSRWKPIEICAEADPETIVTSNNKTHP